MTGWVDIVLAGNLGGLTHMTEEANLDCLRANILRLSINRDTLIYEEPRIAENSWASSPPVLKIVGEKELPRLAAALQITLEELMAAPNALASAIREDLDEALRCWRQGDSDAAVVRTHNALKSARRLGFPVLAGEASALLAEIYVQQARLDEAIVYALAALVSPWSRDRTNRQTASLMLMRLFLNLGQTRLARAIAEMGLDPWASDSDEYFHTLITWAKSLDQGGYRKAAIEMYHRIIGEAHEADKPRYETQGLVGLAATQASAGIWRTALITCSQAVTLAGRHDWNDLQTQALATRVWCQTMMGSIDKARKAIRFALARTSDNDQAHRADLYDTWAIREIQEYQWANAIQAAESGLAAVERATPHPLYLVKARLIWCLAVAKAHKGDNDALIHREWALDLFRAIGGGFVSASFPDPALPPWPES